MVKRLQVVEKTVIFVYIIWTSLTSKLSEAIFEIPICDKTKSCLLLFFLLSFFFPRDYFAKQTDSPPPTRTKEIEKKEENQMKNKQTNNPQRE